MADVIRAIRLPATPIPVDLIVSAWNVGEVEPNGITALPCLLSVLCLPAADLACQALPAQR
jgi:hypothetical protein